MTVNLILCELSLRVRALQKLFMVVSGVSEIGYFVRDFCNTGSNLKARITHLQDMKRK